MLRENLFVSFNPTHLSIHHHGIARIGKRQRPHFTGVRGAHNGDLAATAVLVDVEAVHSPGFCKPVK
jgi:hypothetical protein